MNRHHPLFFTLRLLGLVTLLASVGRGQEIGLNDSSPAGATVPIGAGSGSMSVGQKVVHLEGTPSSFAKYSDDMTEDAAVFDYRLPQPVPLAEGADKVGLSYVLRDDNKNNNAFQLGLRLLIQDSRGGVWAVQTRFGSTGDLSHGPGKSALETYVLTTTELGRIDPWVMMSLDPKAHDDYDLPKPPYQLAGFRIVARGKENQTFAMDLHGLRSLKSDVAPSPYWLFSSETPWNIRKGHEYAPWGNYGWGADQATPNLRGSDLSLSPGDYTYSWELLDLNGISVLAKQLGGVSVKDPGLPAFEFPLLPKGTYHLRLSLRSNGETDFHDYYLLYVVIRDAGGAAPAASVEASPLTVEGLHGVSFRAGNLPTVTLRSQAPAGGKQALVKWSIEAADTTPLASGQGPAGTPIPLNLNKWIAGQSTLWLDAKLSADGHDVDQAERFVGVKSPPPTTLPENNAVLPKQIVGSFSRTKCDWSEGSEPIATKAAQIQQEVGPWLQEGVQIGYNVVELPATWYDLNPLPDVYQFQYLDKLIAMAKADHLHVTLRMHNITGLMPLWVKQEYQQSQEGLAHGLWGGASVMAPTPFEPVYNEAAFKFMTALSAHYRNDPTVLGYVLAGMFFDHDWLDNSWNGEYVDYSEAAQKAFQQIARRKYGSLAKASAAYGLNLHSWGDLKPPLPAPQFDEAGRLKPRIDAIWRDWIAAKVDAMTANRLGEIHALRAGDPTCGVGIYQTDSTSFYWKQLKEMHVWLPSGSMESQFPLMTMTVPGRYEPIGKMASTAELVDIGMTNVLLQAPPGFNSINNYWGFQSRLSTVQPLQLDAENRFKTWFGVVDQLMGAQFTKKSSDGEKKGAYLVSYDTQLNVWQNTCLGRFDDYLRPYVYRLGTDKLDVDMVHFDPGHDFDINAHAYYYVPYSTMVMEQSVAKSLVEFVKRGGRLILEGTGGYWSETNQPNLLAGAFGLPPAVPSQNAPAPTESATWQPSSPFGNVPVSFRTQEFLPPVEQQLSPWVNTIARSALRPCRWQGALPAGAEVLARFADNQPAVVRLKVGQGEVLDFCGTINWFDTPGLNATLDSWGRQQPITAVAKADPVLLTQPMVKGTTDFVVGRRFIGQGLISGLIAGKPDLPGTQALAVTIPQADPSVKSYRVRELLGGTDLGSVAPDTLVHQGVTLNLTPGQAFILEAAPEGGEAGASTTSTQK